MFCQTRLQREILKSGAGDKIEIFIPGMERNDLAQAVHFFYNGMLHYEDQKELHRLLDLLKSVFDFATQDMTFDVPVKNCPLCHTDVSLANFNNHFIAEIEKIIEDLKDQFNVSINCLICHVPIPIHDNEIRYHYLLNHLDQDWDNQVSTI